MGPATKTRYLPPTLINLNGAGNKNPLPAPYIQWGRQQKPVTGPLHSMGPATKTRYRPPTFNGGQQKHVTHPT
ncbi:MAG: hypothetical protein DRR16_10730 [Candidatus Parabeggiatoa sp. nov. 3]|nr:MAG: hypothetical protein DRR00_16045 [Gammaproteobacteria bacterium]RKZ86012.1 MAG: hypothetical protein DRR16_10730 [Gammaproteobacteria bacterium]HEW98031.1 hypothetical protein [Beggiatoa sp.]